MHLYCNKFVWILTQDVILSERFNFRGVVGKEKTSLLLFDVVY